MSVSLYRWTEACYGQPCPGDCDLCFKNCEDEDRMEKCSWRDGISIKPDGIHEADPCLYQEIDRVEHCTIHVLRCVRCGHIEITWERECTDESSNLSM